jgi:hypothetical protein
MGLQQLFIWETLLIVVRVLIFGDLDWTRRVVLEPLSSYDVHMVTGNHDMFLRKNSNKVNSPELLLKEYQKYKNLL